MRNILFLLILFFAFENCSHKTNEIKIYFENNSDIAKSITVLTFINNRQVDKRAVIRDTIADRFQAFSVKPQETDKPPYKITFKLSGRIETTTCVINPDSIKDARLHVNFVEELFKKGNQYESRILDNDTIVRKDFYCEILR